MKRANFTLFQSQRWMSLLGKSTLMVLFLWCCVGLQSAEAQIITKHKLKDTTVTTAKITACTGTVDTSGTIFTDDGSNDGNYADGHARRDTIEICPKDDWHRVKVVFTEFDLDEGDTLFAFNGNKAALHGANAQTGANFPLGIGSGAGTGASKAFGGWIDASCDPKVNKTGCLTFVFHTDNDNSKGAGWEAWVGCEARDITLGTVDIPSRKLTCDSAAYGIITIPAPEVKACKVALPTASDSVRTVIKNQLGVVCIDTCLTNAGAISSVTDTFAIGIYNVEYTLKSDPTKKKTATFSVQAPSLVCNNKIEVPFGSACMIQLTPDDLLESPCDTITDTMYYNITVTLGSGKTQKVLKTTGYNTGAAVTYPIITVADIKAAGMTVCEATANVTVERVYYGRLSNMTICNNGPQNASCSTTLSFNDQSQPFITLSTTADTLVACDTTGLGALLNPKAIDNCDSDVPVTYTVTMQETDPCFNNAGKPDTTTAVVNFSAADDCGNVGTFSKTFTIIRPNENHYAEARTPKARDCKDGDNESETPGLKIGSIKNGVFKATDTIHLNTTDYICGYILTKKDVEIPSTDCGRKIYRYWSIIDWCTPDVGPSVMDTTFIEYTDTKAPVFQGEATAGKMPNRDIELGPFTCTYDITKLDAPKATDNCDDSPDVRIDSIFRIEDGTKWGVAKGEWSKLDCDSFEIRWVVEDQCHEQLKNDTSNQIVVIKDVTKPSAICTDKLIVSVPSNEGARIKYSDIDAGSTDACGIDRIRIRRKGTTDAWAEYVDVRCEDVHNDLQIEMRVWDKKGNYNTCWASVTAEDKIAPICGNLDPVSKTCDEYHNGELGAATNGEFVELTGDLLALYNKEFGNPATVCEDNLSCAPLTITQYYKLKELNCGALEIERKWKAEDWKPNVSNEGTQKITVTYKPDWKLTFPKDVDLTCGDEFPAAATADDIISNGSCDLWAVEVTEKTFEVPGDICMKIERTYELINWCVYKAGDPATVIANNPNGTMVTSEGNETVGRYTYVQVLKLYVNEAPTIEIADVETCIVGVGDVAPYGTEDVTPGAAPFECDDERTFSATATNCAGIALDGGAFTWKFYVNGSLADEGTGAEFTKVVSPKTKYKVEFWGSDGCGNSAGATKDYEFWDCKKPTPYVLNGLAVEIMQTGSIQMWATDLDQGSYDNCTPKDKLDIRIALGDPNQGPQDIDGVKALDKVVTLTCDNLGTQSVSIYVIDEENNWDVVGTYVLVQNNMGACPTGEGMRAVAGKVVNPVGENVELVNVSVNGGTETAMTTGANGEFQFNLSVGGDYTITPEKNINPLNGVSTYDLVLISKHILGIAKFDSPYKYIAADVNKSGSITAFDMVQLRQLILNITSEFPNNSSWRFVDSKYEFTSENPAAENFNEFMSINNLEGTMNNVDFVATKIGDINGNATSNSLLGAESRTTNGTMSLNVADRFVEAGQTVEVAFNAADIASVEGYQFTMNFNGLELVELTEGVAKAANFNTNLSNRGMISTSWNGEATANEELFKLTFKATSTGLLSELVSISSDLTSAEAYNTAGELMDVNIDFNSSNVSAAFGLNQNTPNPFNAETVIGFNLPQAGAATLKVMDVQGKVLRTIEGDYAKGYNQVSLNAKTLGATGILYYQLESADNIATKKMIIIE
jgi:uncharacterized Zn-binding protein involved in type VI secretion